MATIRFDEAWQRANAFVQRHLERLSETAVLVRDLHGKFRIALDDRGGASVPAPQKRQELATELHGELGPWSPGSGSIFLVASQMFAPEEIFDAPDLLWVDPARRQYRVLDRNVIGADWLREPFPARPEPRRVTLFAIKGGVGRSTAAAVLAWRLSQTGRRTLVLDLDFESPGVGTTLLPPDRAPDFGLLDAFVEEGVGQADEELLREMVAPSPLGEGGAELLIAPAGGRPREGYTYLPKLNRAYAELGSESGPRSFGERLHELICRLEELYRPDVTLLDSRAGLHDIAAVAVTRLHAAGLLFAVDSSQTWQAYRALFETWHEHYDRAEHFRENLKTVAAQIPETGTRAYLDGFRHQAYNLFADHLYVEVPPEEDAAFNFDLADPDAPHTPLRIHWSRALQQFDPVRQPGAVTEEQLRAAFGDFLNGVGLFVFGEPIE